MPKVLFPSLITAAGVATRAGIPVYGHIEETAAGGWALVYRWIRPGWVVESARLVLDGADRAPDPDALTNVRARVSAEHGQVGQLRRLFRAGVEHVRTPLMPEGDEMRPLFDKIGARRWEEAPLFSAFQRVQEGFSSLLEARFTTAEARIARGESINDLFKGLTFGSSRNVFGFHMKALKDAYEVLGFKSQTYRGLRVSSFGNEHLIRYAEQLRTGYPSSLQIQFDPYPAS